MFLNSTLIIHIEFWRAVRSRGAAGVAAQAVGKGGTSAVIYSCNKPARTVGHGRGACQLMMHATASGCTDARS